VADDSPMRWLWARTRAWVDENAGKYLYVRIPSDRADAPQSDAALTPMGSYLRVWLCELYLRKSTAWGKTWFPAVHAEVQLKFGDLDAATFSRVVRPPDQELAKGVRLNYRLTELLPYNGGVVEIRAALLALQGADPLGAALGVLQEFSALVAPPLGQALTLAAKVSTGTRDLLGATHGGVHLGFHETFVAEGGGGGNVLRPGYVAVVLASRDQLDPARLRVVDDQLHLVGDGDASAPLQGFDYMLLRIEGRRERDDWRLRNIEEPLEQAILALSQGETSKADAYRTVALATAWRSSDLAVLDRRRVVAAIKEELAQIDDEGFGAVGGDLRSLDAIMASRAMPSAQAAALGDLSAEEVFAR
jgi:hypothetical protein